MFDGLTSRRLLPARLRLKNARDYELAYLGFEKDRTKNDD